MSEQRIDDLWQGQEHDPCERCRGICTYCIVTLRNRQPAGDMHIVPVDGATGPETTLHICEPHKQRLLRGW